MIEAVKFSSGMEISSAQNPRYKNWLKLLDGRGIKKQKQALVTGRSFIGEILARHPERVLAVIASLPGNANKSDNKPYGLDELTECAPLRAMPLYLLPPDLFAALDIYGIKAPILLVSAPPLPVWDGTLASGLTVFVPFQNPINLGTTIRSAAAFGARVVLLREAATPYLPKALRAAGPAVFQVTLYQGPGIADLAEFDLPIFALSPKGSDIFRFTFPDPIGLVAGMEGPGLDAYWSIEKRLSIPMRPNVESLNASVALSIVMAMQTAKN
ncbi:MAG: RNA methyltransferase [Deltaproteobacteria bacterium]|jgi:tRNA G18 (ribose-2'-O)-methylase SpoU|nr:RNA methyltransferase [Deltaproteobacteria bacterium]